MESQRVAVVVPDQDEARVVSSSVVSVATLPTSHVAASPLPPPFLYGSTARALSHPRCIRCFDRIRIAPCSRRANRTCDTLPCRAVMLVARCESVGYFVQQHVVDFRLDVQFRQVPTDTDDLEVGQAVAKPSLGVVESERPSEFDQAMLGHQVNREGFGIVKVHGTMAWLVFQRTYRLVVDCGEHQPVSGHRNQGKSPSSSCRVEPLNIQDGCRYSGRVSCCKCSTHCQEAC